VPAPGPGVCHVCCGAARPDDALCYSCRAVGRRLGVPLVPVLPVRLCPLPGPLYRVLMGYKESPVDDARRRFAPLLRTLVDDFLSVHAPCVVAAAGGPLDYALPVPSTARPGGPPLDGVDGLAASVRTHTGVRWRPDLLTRAAAPLGHMRPDRGAYAVGPGGRAEVAGTRILLLDDTYVSGARAQSAAAALRGSGARSVVVVALGRVLRPDRSALQADFLSAHHRPSGAPVPGPCCRCRQTAASTE
jgi:hypothetical protein